jgi:Flp pilus assembly pilin Flp
MRKGRRLPLGQGMTEYAIIVALVAISGITAFSYFGGVQRSQVAAITQELAGQESGDMLDLAANYARRARDAASRDIDLGNFYAGGGSSGGGSGTGGGSGGGIGGGWTPPGGGIFPPPGGGGGIFPPPGGGGMCPASAAAKASGTMYVWAADEGCDDEAKKLEQDKEWLEAQIDLLFCHNQDPESECEPVLKEANAFFGTNGADFAAKEVLNALTALAHQAQLEVGGYINKMTTRSGTVYYQYTKPIVGERRSVALSPAPRQIGYHTHPSGTLLFSNNYTNPGAGDAKWVSEASNHLYVGALHDEVVKIGICEFDSACMTGPPGRGGNEPTRIIP